MSALLEPEEDTLIWSAWVFLKELSLTVLILHGNVICCSYIPESNLSDEDILRRFAHVADQDCGVNHVKRETFAGLTRQIFFY